MWLDALLIDEAATEVAAVRAVTEVTALHITSWRVAWFGVRQRQLPLSPARQSRAQLSLRV
jgi:hypothetical protein